MNAFYTGFRTFTLVAAAALWMGCGPQGGGGASDDLKPAMTGSIAAVMQERGLTEADALAAVRTYTPTGGRDPYLLFASGGHAGHVVVIGVPSMRILKYIGVFTPEPWQGYGYGDETTALIASGDRYGKSLTWADTHHPALSETKGDYDGEFLFINDKANARIAVIRLSDYTTSQIVTSNLI